MEIVPSSFSQAFGVWYMKKGSTGIHRMGPFERSWGMTPILAW